MGIGVKVKVWGDYALFSRPELKVERYSYDVMTPSAARGILEAIYWHPGLRWKIDRIYVNKPIRFTSVRRNEVKSKALIIQANLKTLCFEGSREGNVITCPILVAENFRRILRYAEKRRFTLRMRM